MSQGTGPIVLRGYGRGVQVGNDVSSKPRKSSTMKGFDTFEEAVEFLRTRVNVEQTRPSQVDSVQVFNLERMTELMAALGDPQKAIRTVHVAGSKGKGSVCEMTAAGLQACGLTVGLYTSPHLVNLTERIRINRREITGPEFAQMLERAAAAAEDLPKRLGDVTYFEFLTAIAFQHFAEQAVDIAVIEVGMGGRVDATNIITPEVTAITAIQKEHTAILGDTLEKIAAEKAGVIKAGVPCITLPQDEKVMEVLRAKAAEVQTRLEVLGQEIDFTSRLEASHDIGPHARVCLSSARSNFEHVPVPLKGEHQALNCGLALAILDRLRERGIETPEGKVATGLARTPANGRLELVHTHPRVYIDGAHNPESMQALMKAVGSHIRYDSMVVVFGCAADKDVPALLSAVATGADKIFFTKAEGSGRAADPRELHRKFVELGGKMAHHVGNLTEAIRSAGNAVASKDKDIILITGSFSIAGEAKRLLLEKYGPPAQNIEGKPPRK